MTQTLVRSTRCTSWRPDRLADTVLVLLAITVVQRLVGFLRSVLFCRWLDPTELGQWDMAFGFIELAAPLAVLGLPGSFGRYVEHYRQHGHLRTFLRRTTAATAVATVVGVAFIAAGRNQLSHLIFGSPNQSELVVALAAGLGAIVFYNVLSTLFTALRRNRMTSCMEFMNSALFATLSIGLLSCWRMSALSIILAYSLACLVTALAATIWLRPMWRTISEPDTTLTHRALWSKLMPFAVWVWGTNWLANVFETVDRYMIVHSGGLDPMRALTEVGNYHSSRVLPVLLVSITGLLGTMITPYLSHDFETGGRQAVSARMNLTVKLLSTALLFGAAMILILSPLVFGIAFKGKFSGGFAVLPLTLTYCIWFGMARVAQKYLWCVERVGSAAGAWLLGLLVNIGLNLLLLPRFGLAGVVVSTAVGNLATLLALYMINWVHGMRLELGTVALSMAPLLLVFGGWTTLVGWALILCVSFGTNCLFNSTEKKLLADVGREYLDRLGRLTNSRTRAASEGAS